MGRCATESAEGGFVLGGAGGHLHVRGCARSAAGRGCRARGSGGGGGERGGSRSRGEGEEVDAGVELPEAFARDEHAGPAFACVADAVFGVEADGGVFGGYQAHALEFGQEVFAFEDTFAVDVDAPFAFGAAFEGGGGGGGGGELGGGFGLVEVPP